MDIVSIAMLEDTLDELDEKRAKGDPDSRFDECVTVIRACIHLLAAAPANPDYANKIRNALTELAGIARENGEFTIAKRLKLLIGGANFGKSSMIFHQSFSAVERYDRSHLP